MKKMAPNLKLAKQYVFRVQEEDAKVIEELAKHEEPDGNPNDWCKRIVLEHIRQTKGEPVKYAPDEIGLRLQQIFQVLGDDTQKYYTQSEALDQVFRELVELRYLVSGLGKLLQQMRVSDKHILPDGGWDVVVEELKVKRVEVIKERKEKNKPV